jgi:hypothetical protein
MFFNHKLYFHKSFFRNLVDDIAQVEFLVLCPELKRLTLEGNPVCMKPRPDCSPQV